MNRPGILLNSLLLSVLVSLWWISADEPGHLGRGVVLLPNGWKIAPAGKHLQLDDLPLEMAESIDGKYLIVTNNGYSPPVLSVIDLQHFYVRERLHVKNAWLGLIFSPDGKKLYSGSGGANEIQVFQYQNGGLREESSFSLTQLVGGSFLGGLTISGDGSRLFTVHVLGNRLDALDAQSGKLLLSRSLDAEPYTVLRSPDGRRLFVSLWGGARVLEFDAQTLAEGRTFKVGEHPNAMALSTDANRLFVACGNTNAVWVIDLRSGKAIEQISVALYPMAPAGSTPSYLSVSPDGKRLLVTNSDNNAFAVVDISNFKKSKVLGFIPTGWYPTAARFSRDGKRIFVLSGKGLASVPNVRGPDEPNYIAQMLLGTLSIIEPPDYKQLSAYTKTVYELTPYSDAIRLTPPQTAHESVIPSRVGAKSPIRYVFYIIRENRTYDQVFGDMEKGNGDPRLCLFGEDVTPNAHALAREFVLFDNFYVDAEVSADGHAFSMGAYANDFIEKTWPMNYAERGARYMTDGLGPVRTAYGNIAAPPQGYIWDAALRHGLTVRSYGEFGHRGFIEGEDVAEEKVEANVPGLRDHISPDYPPWNLEIPDNRRVDAWLKEFREYEKNGNLPRLSIIYLPNDHTSGTRPGSVTPKSMVAENDLALGRVVEAITHSRYWKESAIFSLEDDAQDGPDHVDAHRSVLLALSPYTHRGAIDSTMYTTSGVLRTIELILGLEPMSQYDAAATPLYAAFSRQASDGVYNHRPSRISLDERNPATAFGAAESNVMDFSEPDRIPMRELNEILWKSIKGASTIMPPPVRAAFISPQTLEVEK